MEDLAHKLASIDELETWKLFCQGYSTQDKKMAFQCAQPLWIQRKISEGTLYLHPEVIEQIRNQNWNPSDIQLRMIWASVLASAEGHDSKVRFQSIKNSLRKRYGYEWWEDVYRRQKPAFAAKERIRKQRAENGVAANTLIANTHLFGEAAKDQVKAALKMIPKS